MARCWWQVSERDATIVIFVSNIPHIRYVHGVDFSGAQDAGKSIWVATGIIKETILEKQDGDPLGVGIASCYFILISLMAGFEGRGIFDAPPVLQALRHDFLPSLVALALVFSLAGGDFYGLPSDVQGKLTLIPGTLFYVLLGVFLGWTYYQGKVELPKRGLFFGTCFSLLGYSIGAAIDGHPPIFILLNPPFFFLGGFLFAVLPALMRRKPKDDSGNSYDDELESR